MSENKANLLKKIFTWSDDLSSFNLVSGSRARIRSRVLESMSAFLADCKCQYEAGRIIETFCSLGQDKQIEILDSPELYKRLTWLPSRPGYEAWVLTFLRDALFAADTSSKSRLNDFCIDKIGLVWSALGDKAYTRDDGTLVHKSLLIRDTIVVDSKSPICNFRPDGTEINESHSRSNLPIVSDRDFQKLVNRSISLVAYGSSLAEKLILANTKTYVLQSDPKFGAFSTISGRAYPGQVIFRNLRKTDLDKFLIADCILHESMHSFMYEMEQAGSWVKQVNTNGYVVSPWTKNNIRIDSYLHACFVWFGLANFWEKLRVSKPRIEEECLKFRNRALSGFESPTLVDRLAEWRWNIKEDVLNEIKLLPGILFSNISRH